MDWMEQEQERGITITSLPDSPLERLPTEHYRYSVMWIYHEVENLRVQTVPFGFCAKTVWNLSRNSMETGGRV